MRRLTKASFSTLAAGASAFSLAEVCTVSNVRAALPSNGKLLGINLLPATVTAIAVYNASAGSGPVSERPSSGTVSTYSYCNITVAYTHQGKGDQVLLKLAFPQPSDYKSRLYVAGGGGFSLSSDATGGLSYGGAGAATSAGYDAFTQSYDEALLYGNGSINWDATYMFGHQALGEMTKIAKAILPSFYKSSNESTNHGKLYTYFEGCSDGGREAMSQVQRWGDEYDGVIAGAPAFRFAQQQVLHVYPATIEHMLGYYPPPCALEKIVNETISACDPLDGRADGVVSRTDLCQLNFNLSSLIGTAYSCAATTSSSLGFGFSKRQAPGGSSGGATGSQVSSRPAQNGTLNVHDIAVAQAVYRGLHDSSGQRAYLSWQISSELSDAEPIYDNTTSSWTLNIPSTGGEYITKFIQLLDLDNLSNLDGITYDTLVEWMTTGLIRYTDSLQTTLPDISIFQKSGGKLLHYHGESDPSVPAASSVHYYQSVRQIMYPELEQSEAEAALREWYQLYLIPGAAHCGANSLQPGPYPQTNMEIMIDWVENGVVPQRLNTTVSSGKYAGETQMLCQWPKRPLWQGNSNTSECDCVRDEKSEQSWTYKFDAFKLPIY